MKKISLLASSVIAGVSIASLIGATAVAAPCVSAPVATYTAAGFSCNVDGFTFSNIIVNTTASSGGSVTLGNFTPVNPAPGEAGLLLNYYRSCAGREKADITWTYNVSRCAVYRRRIFGAYW